MPKLPRLTFSRIVAILKQNGFVLDHTTGSHFIFYNSETKKRATVPRYGKNIPIGTLISILKQAGISRDNLSR